MYVVDKDWRTSKAPRRWTVGKRVIGIQTLNGREYRKWYFGIREYELDPDWKLQARKYPGTLIKNEWKNGQTITQVRYTVRCDDGKTRFFQVLRDLT